MNPLDQNRKNGKYLSIKSGIIKKVSILDYNFEEITNQKPLLTDNAFGSVVFANLHDENETKSLPLPDHFNDELANVEHKNPVIFAQDFTNDWSQSSLNKNKIYNILEDENELDPLETLRVHQKNARSSNKNSGVENANASTPHTENQSNEARSDLQQTSDLGGKDPKSSKAKTTQEMNPGDSSNSNATRNPEMATIDLMSKVISDLQPQIGKNQDDPENSVHLGSKDENTDFIPIAMEKNQGKSFEEGARMQYLAQKELEEIRKKAQEDALTEAKKNINIERIEAEAKSRGYEVGFKEGEAKGVMAAQQKKEELALNIEKILDEFGNLKFNILENAQENFLELAQAICEVILDENFKLNPHAFGQVIQHAITQATQSDQFLIYVSPERYDSLKDINIPGFKDRLRSDRSLQKDDFKIDSDLTAVSGNIRQMISDLLRKANIKLFEGVS